MFNDKYLLTQAVLNKYKIQTRRIIPNCSAVRQTPFNKSGLEDNHGRELKPKYEIGEVVAIAQAYNDFYNEECDPRIFPDGAGWTNKMFVKPDLMPHHIRITDIRVERLQEISDEDCLAEGVREVEINNNWGNMASHTEYRVVYMDKYGREKLLIGKTPQEAYAVLIDYISGRGTWDSNPYVFVYNFKLID